MEPIVIRLATSTLLAAATLAACSRKKETPRPPPPLTSAEDRQWQADLLERRRHKDESFRTSTTSPMAGTRYLLVEDVDEIHVAGSDGRFELVDTPGPGVWFSLVRHEGGDETAGEAEGTGHAGHTHSERDHWRWRDAGRGATCTVAGAPLASDSVLAGPAEFSVERFTLAAYPGADKVSFVVFDPERAEKKSFKQLEYFPPDRRYVITAEFAILDDHERVTMLTSQNLEKVFYRYARMRFQLQGRDQELTAYKSALTGDGSDTLFIPFRDATSGVESYGAGRFLDLPDPEGNTITIDFNDSYNPLCNYSPAYNCPIPPKENRLQVAVRSGEKTYPH